MTIREAANDWVTRCMDAIDTCILRKLYNFDPDDWHEVTVPSVGDRVYVFNECAYGDITDFDEKTGFEIELDDGSVIHADADDFELESDSVFPMWNTMWSFSDSADIYWLENGGIKALSDCGFRVYESDEFGFYFGIDGAGYDFYEAHWLPLYKARGLCWHDTDDAA